MTIREMETVTGLTRANIRFYEAQGLIAPERKENNYREYSEQDAQVLLRIKLLRALGMTIEQIRALQDGSEHLITALDRQIEALSRQQEQLGHSQRVCREMRQDNVSFSTLDARRYLNSLDNPPRTEQVIARDAEPKTVAPWQRYWARALDGFVYGMVLVTAVTWITKGLIPQWGNFLTILFGIGMTMLLEPVQLRLFGTTLGKWIFGIRVTDPDGRNLSISDGIYRTWDVIFRGEGLQIPVMNLWRLWMSYQICRDGDTLNWEYDSELTVKDTRPVRYLAALGTAAAVFALSVVLMVQAQMPENRGGLTVADYCENYRKIAHQERQESERYVLNDDGTWSEQQTPGVVYIDLDATSGPLDLCFMLDESREVTQVQITESLDGPQEGWVTSRSTQRRLMALSLLMAQPEYSIYKGMEKEILTAIAEHPFEPFQVSSCGLLFQYEVEYTGYWATDFSLIEDDDPNTEPTYRMTFTVTKEE